MSLATSGILRPSPIIEALVELSLAQLKAQPFGSLLMVVKAPNDDDGGFIRELEAKVLLDSAVRSIHHSWLSTSELPILRLEDTEVEEIDQVELLAELSQSPHCLIPLGAQQVSSSAKSKAQFIEIGRSPNSDIVLSDPSVSAQHARVELIEGGLRISDLASKNGTLLNGVALSTEEARWLQPMDRLQLGRVTAFVCEPRILRGLLRYDLKTII